jgi:fructuronate reductase
VVASLDNVASNGATLRAAVVAMAAVADEALAGWIGDLVAFPSSVVDRIVPATPEDLSAHLASVHGIDDAVPILTEPHRSWAIEAVDGLDPWGRVGVEVVDDVSAHERGKLWILNGPHSAAAIAGLARGHETIAEAVADPVVRALVVAVAAGAIEVADLPAALDGERFAAEVLERFANPVLGHRCAQVATDSEHKLPLRIVPVLEERLARGLDAGAGARVLATWSVAAGGPDASRLLSSLTPAARAAVAAVEPVDGRSADVASR